ncbi:MAG: hypothetical protein WGN25_03970 [Candidatus Electrothrix sp. GW3-4]
MYRKTHFLYMYRIRAELPKLYSQDLLNNLLPEVYSTPGPRLTAPA